jgi:hypothetical protein
VSRALHPRPWQPIRYSCAPLPCIKPRTVAAASRAAAPLPLLLHDCELKTPDTQPIEFRCMLLYLLARWGVETE